MYGAYLVVLLSIWKCVRRANMEQLQTDL
jgi:hypothetical protein